MAEQLHPEDIYQTLEETLGVMPPFWTEYVRTLQGVFLDEVV